MGSYAQIPQFDNPIDLKNYLSQMQETQNDKAILNIKTV